MADRAQHRLAIDEVTLDAFAGGGGASEGIEQAYRELGFREAVDIAVNHDEDAIAMHTANHPATLHLREDVFKCNIRRHVGRRTVRLLWLSPDCKHFSKAKGGKPVEKRIRGLAWVGVKWAKKLKPRVIALENVEEFQHWGPLVKTADGWFPDPARKGQTFQRFVGQLRKIGYRIEWRELRACDYGAPTIRKRLILLCRRDKEPIVWPKATHGLGTSRPYLTAASCIDFGIDCPSIFTRDRDLADATLRRIARGTKRYVLDAADPFIVNMAHGGKVEPITSPFSTIATEKGGCRAIAVPTLIQTGYGERPGQAPRVPGLHKPIGTLVDGQKHAVVTAFLAQHNNHRGVEPHPGHDARKPMSTVPSKPQQGLVTSHLVKLKGTCKDGQPVTEPAPTVQAGGLHAGEVRAFLVKYFSTAVGQRLAEPAATLTALPRLGLLQAQIAPLTEELVERARKVADLLRKYGEWDEREFVTVEIRGAVYVVVDLGMRMLTPRELARAQGFPDSYVIDRGADGRPLTKKAQVRMIGNSVCPPLAKAIVLAQFAAEAALVKPRRKAA